MNSVIPKASVFTVRAADAFPAIQHRTHAALATLRGHRASLRLRGMSDGLFADVVAWDSLEAAQQASNTVREDPRFSALMSSIMELKLYAHYQLGVDPAALLAELRRAPLVEVAASTVGCMTRCRPLPVTAAARRRVRSRTPASSPI